MKELFSSYILAGGKSSRMGTDKAFLRIGGRTFIENAAAILKPHGEQVNIILNKSQTHFIEKLPAEISYIFDIFENCGAPGGIYAALKNCKTEFALILAVDVPLVTNEALKKLCEIAIDSKEFSAFVPRQTDGKLQPLCAIYQVEDCLPKLEEMLSKNQSISVRDFLETIKTKIVDAAILGDENMLANINSPQDFVKYQGIFVS